MPCPNAKNSTSTHAKWKSIASHRPPPPHPRYNCWVHNNNRTSIKMSSYKVKIIHALYSRLCKYNYLYWWSLYGSGIFLLCNTKMTNRAETTETQFPLFGTFPNRYAYSQKTFLTIIVIMIKKNVRNTASTQNFPFRDHRIYVTILNLHVS